MTDARNDGTGRRNAVLVVGAGGLGCPALLTLASAGVRRLGVADPDVVEPSNLHRQLLHTSADVGRNKAEVAAERLETMVCGGAIEAWPVAITAATATMILPRYDFIVDATDGASSKFLLNDAAVRLGLPLAHAGVVGLAGQCLTILPGQNACLRCLFPEEPSAEEVPACREAGILGPVAGLLGALEAAEAVRFLEGQPCAFADRLLTIDARNMRFRTVPLRRSPACPCCAEGADPRVEDTTVAKESP